MQNRPKLSADLLASLNTHQPSPQNNKIATPVQPEIEAAQNKVATPPRPGTPHPNKSIHASPKPPTPNVTAPLPENNTSAQQNNDATPGAPEQKANSLHASPHSSSENIKNQLHEGLFKGKETSPLKDTQVPATHTTKSDISDTARYSPAVEKNINSASVNKQKSPTLRVPQAQTQAAIVNTPEQKQEILPPVTPVEPSKGGFFGCCSRPAPAQQANPEPARRPAPRPGQSSCSIQ